MHAAQIILILILLLILILILILILLLILILILSRFLGTPQTIFNSGSKNCLGGGGGGGHIKAGPTLGLLGLGGLKVSKPKTKEPGCCLCSLLRVSGFVLG